MYQLKREMRAFTQSNLFVILYFTKLKKLWDELACLEPLSRGEHYSVQTEKNQLSQINLEIQFDFLFFLV